MTKRPVDFKPFAPGDTLCPVVQVTPEDGFYAHRFFDTSPWSPSGRYLTVLRMPYQDREPAYGDPAGVCVVDLEERTIEDVATTRAWCVQMGAQQQWGVTDRFLYFNDLRDGVPVCVRYDLDERETFYCDGPLYQVSPDGAYALGSDLFDIHRTQGGYGVTPPPERSPALRPGAGGRVLWRTDLETGRREAFITLEELRRHLPSTREFKKSALVGFHVKFNAQHDRLLFVVRAMDAKTRHGRLKRRPTLLTMTPAAGDVTVALPNSEWSKGGHHPNWHPDGVHCSMNLKLDGHSMRFVHFRYDGSGLRVLLDEVPGSGHPSFAADGRHLLTDAYVGDENVPDRDGSVPIRLVDIEARSHRDICWIPAAGAGRGALRCDPHPAWNAGCTRVCFNGAPEGRRQVFVADVRAVLAGGSG